MTDEDKIMDIWRKYFQTLGSRRHTDGENSSTGKGNNKKKRNYGERIQQEDITKTE